MDNKKDWDEAALNHVESLVSQSCIKSLRAVHKLYHKLGPAEAFENTDHLAAYAEQAAQSVALSARANAVGDEQTAKMQWASALVLMDMLNVESGNILNDPMVLAAVEYQKSGKTA